MIDAASFAEVSQLIHEFWSNLDRNDYPGVLQCILPDGRWNRAGRWREGHDDIALALEERPAGLFVRHLVSTLRADREGEDIVCRFYLVAFSSRAADESPPPYPVAAPTLIADYTAVCALTSEGWRFRSLSGSGAFRAAPAAP